MLDIESLYNNSENNSYLKKLSSKNFLDFNDFKNSVFAEAIESECEDIKDFYRACYRVRYRMKEYSKRSYHLSIPENSIIPCTDNEIERITMEA